VKTYFFFFFDCRLKGFEGNLDLLCASKDSKQKFRQLILERLPTYENLDGGPLVL